MSTARNALPTILIWESVDGHPYGHAALRTDKYHISLWPNEEKQLPFPEASTTGRLHFHEHLDWISEGNSKNPIRGPTARHEIVNVTNEAINRVYEEFLFYNGIDPEEVTLAAAKKKLFQLCHKRLPLTRYSLVGDVIVDKRIAIVYSDLLFFIKRCLTPGWGNINICSECINTVVNQSKLVTCPFYHKAQSCVTICFNLIEMADPRPLVCLVEARNNTRKTLWSRFWQIFSLGSTGICLEITVPNFENHVVKKYWKKGGQRDHYDANVFQKRSRFLMMSENFFKKVLMVGPTIFFMAWLHNCLNYSFLSLFGLSWIIHLIYFLLLFFVQMKLFPFVRLPKFVAFVGGFPSIIALFLLIYFSYSTKIDAFHLEMGGIPNFFTKFGSNIFYYCGFLLFVEISEFFFRFIVDTLVD